MKVTDLQHRWRGILASLGVPTEHLKNRHGPCPMCGGKDRFRFDDKDGRGTWICNRCGAGDGIMLAMRVLRLDFKEALAECSRVAGVGPIGPKQKPSGNGDAKEQLVRVWNESKPIRSGDAADLYLRARGLPSSPILRLHPGLFEAESRRKVPALIAAVSSPDGEKFVSLLRIFIDPENPGKSISKKLMTPTTTVMGGAIRLHEAESVLGVAEGVETALAAHVLSAVPVWSLVMAANMEMWSPPEEVTRLVIFGDNDASYAGQKAAYTLAFRTRQKGLQVQVHIPATEGEDWNDVLLSGNGVSWTTI